MNLLEQFQMDVWPKIVEFLNKNSQAKYTPQGWYGHCIWSKDGDIKRIITKFCEDEFGLINVHNCHGMWYSAFLEQNPLYLGWKYTEDYVRELEKTANKLRNKNKTNPFLA